MDMVSIEDYIIDGSIGEPLDVIARQQLNRQLREILDSLGELERKVVEMHFGLKDGRDMTVEEVADELGVKPERVRSLEAKALRRLRHPALIEKITRLV
jgi:RNA polymerase primary sigma factor